MPDHTSSHRAKKGSSHKPVAKATKMAGRHPRPPKKR